MNTTSTAPLQKLDAIVAQLPYLPKDRKSVQLAKVLYWLAREAESESLHVLHKELAHYIGGTREQVTMFLTGFKRDGLVSCGRAMLRVNVNALRQWIASQQ